MKKIISVLISAALALAVIPATSSVSYAKMSRSAKCKIYAKKEVDRMVERSVGTGLVLGAGTGLLVGSLIGKKRAVPGLAIGAVGGTLAGAVVSSERRKKVYNAAYADCMDY
jgi:hypothetical protein